MQLTEPLLQPDCAKSESWGALQVQIMETNLSGPRSLINTEGVLHGPDALLAIIRGI